MLAKIATLERDVSESARSTKAIDQHRLAVAPAILRHDDYAAQILDADVVIRGADGKKMFFKKRRRLGGVLQQHTDDDSSNGGRSASSGFVQQCALIAPHRVASETSPRSPGKRQRLATQRRIAQALVKRQWPTRLLLQVARVDSQTVIVRIEENVEGDALVLTTYAPERSRTHTLVIPFTSLELVLPAPLVWWRIAEVRVFGSA